ncbi:SDR family oxidoreductase [Rhodanobacter sp. BL-MT-08]
MSIDSGTCAILTGASGGIGQALLRELLAKGAHVLAVVRSPEKLDALFDELSAAKRKRIQVVRADLALPEGRRAVVSAASWLNSAPNLLIHGAASSSFGLFADNAADDVGRLLALNVTSPLQLTHDLLPLLRESPTAQVVAIGSTFGSIGYPGFAAYCASKFALRGAFEALAREHHGESIAFLYMSPRATRTDFNSPEVDALNEALGNRVDSAQHVAAEIIKAIDSNQRRLQIGWPEKWLVRLNSLLPGLLDRGIASQLPRIQDHARRGRMRSPKQRVID